APTRARRSATTASPDTASAASPPSRRSVRAGRPSRRAAPAARARARSTHARGETAPTRDCCCVRSHQLPTFDGEVAVDEIDGELVDAGVDDLRAGAADA